MHLPKASRIRSAMLRRASGGALAPSPKARGRAHPPIGYAAGWSKGISQAGKCTLWSTADQHIPKANSRSSYLKAAQR